MVWESNDSDVATIGDGVIDSPTDVQKLILVMHEGGYYFYTGEGYLYASSSEKNYLRTEATPDANAKADIAFSEGEATIVFQGENTHNVLRFNPNNGSPIFSCYASTSKAGTLPLIYKKVEAPAAEPSIRIAETEITIEATADEGTIDVTYKNIRDEEMRNAKVYTCDIDGNWTEYDWIIAELNQDNNIYFIAYENNTGAERTAYLQVFVGNYSSNIVSITQPRIVLDYAELPFEFNGGSSDIATTDGLTQEGLGSDYSANSAPTTQLKFDNTGDCLLLQVNSSPSLLYFDIKGNGFKDGIFTVSISKDGEAYESLAEFTELGNTQTVGYAVPLGYTYIKWEYTEKVTATLDWATSRSWSPAPRRRPSLPQPDGLPMSPSTPCSSPMAAPMS